MSNSSPGVYLIVQFNWPPDFTREMADGARDLHAALKDADWIQEVLAASGGLGAGPSSIWIFRLQGYASLDRLLHDREDPISKAYVMFFSHMADISESIREQVVFR